MSATCGCVVVRRCIFIFPMIPEPSALGDLPLGALTEAVSAESAAGPTCSSADEVDDDFSILKYEDPVLARPDIAFDMRMGHDSLPQYISLYASDERRPDEATQRLAGVGAAAPGSTRNTTRRPRGGGDDITAVLKAILPNKEYADAAGEWVQTVSGTVRSRGELEKVQNKVEARLATLQARPGAVCAVRESVFSELYDEVIREITLQSPERGLLLLRLRDETRMNLDTYAEIYRCLMLPSCLFQMKKSVFTTELHSIIFDRRTVIN
ncbi:dynein light chain [Ectocarpus siliculosus]|uniref:Dynein light chain n=1 Tax=Ectocarpus siliculosus TaxID=2880 RepID=D7G6Z9_ECTSI|nr:dynein light chain [Ectocarpus siliculosus]|eukprot:CBJ25692.1 dynein light chain [Ectocarpus siliculosus]